VIIKSTVISVTDQILRNLVYLWELKLEKLLPTTEAFVLLDTYNVKRRFFFKK